MVELMLRAQEVRLGDNEPNSGLCWAWQFELPDNPGNVTLRLDVRNCANDNENGVYLNGQNNLVGYLRKNDGDDFEPNILQIQDHLLASGDRNHHFIEIYSGYLNPKSDTDWSRDDIDLRNIRIIHD